MARISARMEFEDAMRPGETGVLFNTDEEAANG